MRRNPALNTVLSLTLSVLANACPTETFGSKVIKSSEKIDILHESPFLHILICVCSRVRFRLDYVCILCRVVGCLFICF